MTSNQIPNSEDLKETSMGSSIPSCLASNDQDSSSKVPEDAEDDIVNLRDYVAEQERLNQEAGETLPLSFDQCSYDKGETPQNVYACLTCSPSDDPAGICYACSIACHGDHYLVEIFAKRAFRCDCGGCKFSTPCTRPPHVTRLPNDKNVYGHNFQDKWCFCDGSYDEEADTMIQCCVCEDWYHDRCIGSAYSFDDYICRTCVARLPFLTKYTNLPEFKVLDTTAPTKEEHPPVEGDEQSSLTTLVTFPRRSHTAKRRRDIQDDTPPPSPRVEHARQAPSPSRSIGRDFPRPKRFRFENVQEKETGSGSDQQPAPPPVPTSEDVCKASHLPLLIQSCDLFCTEGWRTHLCTCPPCEREYEAKGVSWIAKGEEEVWQPEPDEDAAKDLTSLAASHLARLPRDRALDLVNGMHQLKSNLVDFLDELAGRGGDVVKVEDVKEFIQRAMNGRGESTTSNSF
ncbi:hypothetical protein M427DRAFT_136085 [Gonapodya prolifera JEL478]|uniref:UBR-type domain-containing protein n=1 Tax=Gonapodya prolifera (strain JEL478) TaxID=1344416 RepID=A0A139AB82_GONPJ|nr:hypothetical protein M427DRAFT_136085 [Gonapodya prolifera JEL478]|eukprot:KXS13997.1 hypothetical protein M427DRAFT_136085 [Gonapodya prolifera JEL478]